MAREAFGKISGLYLDTEDKKFSIVGLIVLSFIVPPSIKSRIPILLGHDGQKNFYSGAYRSFVHRSSTTTTTTTSFKRRRRRRKEER